MIDQAGWGSTKLYPDGGLAGLWNPQYIVIHWGGLTNQVDAAHEESQLRGWQAYHLRKGWRDIAYHYAVGDSGNFYRLRGENPGGATTGTAPNGWRWNSTGVSIVWIGGQKDEDGPSPAAIATLVKYLDSRGLPVLGHVETGKATACPGQDLLKFVKDYNDGVYEGTPEPIEEGDFPMPTLELYAGYTTKGKRGQYHAVKGLQIMLASRGFADTQTTDGLCAADGKFGPGTLKAVKAFQTAMKLTVDGIVGRDTWEKLA